MDVPAIIQAATGLLWPILVGVVLVLLLPEIKKILGSRAFTVKVGGVEIDVQQAVDKLVKSTAELQARSADSTPTAPKPKDPDADIRETSQPGDGSVTSATIRNILWVDDNPKNNAYETAQMQALGATVQNALSTLEAMNALYAPGADFNLIISDMGRQEGAGPYNTRAGLDLIEQVRRANISTPIVIYAGSSAQALQDEVVRSGATGVATGDRRLFDLLKQVGDFPQ